MPETKPIDEQIRITAVRDYTQCLGKVRYTIIVPSKYVKGFEIAFNNLKEDVYSGIDTN